MQNEKNKPLTIERTVHAPAELVWKALTNKELLQKWLPFFPDFRPEVGFETRFQLGRDESHHYTHVCRVLEVIPGKKLTYTWRYDGYAGDSHVTFELSDEGENTLVTLTHTIIEPFPANNPDFAKKNFAEGWTYTINGLKEFVEKKGGEKR